VGAALAAGGRRRGVLTAIAAAPRRAAVRSAAYARRVTRPTSQPPDQDWRQPLVKVVAAMIVCGVVAAAFIPDRGRPGGYALRSEFVYRVEIGVIALAALLFCLTALRLTSYGRTFTQFGAGPGNVGAPDPARALDDARNEFDTLVEDLRDEIDAVKDYVEGVGRRMDAIDGGIARPPDGPHPAEKGASRVGDDDEPAG
jgi:hypothetical protein